MIDDKHRWNTDVQTIQILKEQFTKFENSLVCWSRVTRVLEITASPVKQSRCVLCQSILQTCKISTCEEVFKIFDTDGNGTICETELGIVLRALGQNPTQEELKDLMEEADLNENGAIEFNEFLVMMIEQMNKPDPAFSEDNLLHAFETFDSDGDGFIMISELKEFFHGVGELTVTQEECKEMIGAEETESKEKMDFDEFKEMMTKELRQTDAQMERRRKSMACLKSFMKQN